MNRQTVFPGADVVWATVGFTVAVSIVVHGVTASPVMSTLERWQAPTPSAPTEPSVDRPSAKRIPSRAHDPRT